MTKLSNNCSLIVLENLLNCIMLEGLNDLLKKTIYCSCKVGDYNVLYQQNCLLTVTNHYN